MLVGDVRCAMRRSGVDLHVVGRQRVIRRPHERVEVLPRLPGRRPGETRGPRRASTSRRDGTGRLRTNAIAGAAAHNSSSGSATGMRARVDRGHGDERAAGQQRTRDHALGERAGARQPAATGRGRGRFPFEQTLVREPDADQRHDDGVQHVVRLAGEQDRLQRAPRRRHAQVVRAPRASGRAVPACRSPPTSASPTGNASAARPIAVQAIGDPGRIGPPGHQERHGRRRHQAAPQVVEDLPPRDERQPIAPPAGARRHHGQQPPQDLPVAAHPAMLAFRMREHARRIVVDDLDVGDERRARVQPLEQVVRQQGVLRHAIPRAPGRTRPRRTAPCR